MSALATFDNNAHTIKEYRETMLYGLDNATDGTAAQQTILQTEYNSILAKYSITSAELNNYWTTQLNATSNKLPTSGCN